jgi:hypothetical protein
MASWREAVHPTSSRSVEINRINKAGAQKSLEVNGSQRRDCFPQGNDTAVDPEVLTAFGKRKRYNEFIGLFLQLSIEIHSDVTITR